MSDAGKNSETSNDKFEEYVTKILESDNNFLEEAERSFEDPESTQIPKQPQILEPMQTEVMNGNGNEISYTSNEEFHAIEINDFNVEVIAFVDSIQASKTVKSQNKKNDEEILYRVMSFMLNNSEGTRCIVSVWGDEIDRIEPDLRVNMVIHIEGAVASKFKNNRWNNSTLNYQLLIKPHTKLNLLKMENVKNINFQNNLKLIEFEDLKTEQGLIKLQGFVKSAFRFLKYKIGKNVISYGCGSITNGKKKIEVRIQNFPDDENYEFLSKGDHVEIQGHIKFTKEENIIYLMAEREDWIQIMDKDKMPFHKLLNIFEVVKKNI
ncbi:uncharacterized protein LOC127286100 [Leptopilina boulardi]|uniref:uncharacterized protein LOC127286100 n=1 Tax=Leptopilina boulardi TaxID=63433 RepID=UPI0021F546D8|nr:uncharacterized protein LOC127286100 [Leptopilina boulardi]XP_051168360.1 uncharacterized protein LOC127286100 [Leptopilina boulardi]